ncbi:MAG: cation-translocating P-type ATPase [Bacteroidia bacterium]
MAVVEATYKIVGMTCQSCAASVRSLLESVPGVKKVEVQFATQEVIVLHETDKAPFDKLREALAPAGYELIPDSRTQLIVRQQYIKRLTHSLYWMGGLALTGMSIHFLMLDHRVYPFALLHYSLTLPSVLWIAGKYFFRPAWQQLRVRQLTMDTLVSLGILGSLLLGGVELYTGKAGHAVVAGAEISFFILIGRLLEEKARYKTQSTLERLTSLAAPTARRLRTDQTIEEVPTPSLKVGDLVEVRAGETFPIDGTILSGKASVSEGLLTGEPFPVEKTVGDKVWAGTQNLTGTVHVRMDVPVQETFLAQLILRVQKAQNSPAHLQRIADHISQIFVPLIITLSALTLFYHLWQGTETEIAWERALSVLVISCPCALGLATPIAVQMAIGSAAGAQILLREVAQLENLPKGKIWAFDKTGTLTHGKISVKEAHWYAAENVPFIVSAVRRSLHPLAQALAEYLTPLAPADLPEPQLVELPGKGLIATFPDRKLYIGNPRWIAEKHPELPVPPDTAVAVATPEKVIAIFTFEDRPREALRTFLSQLKGMGKKLVLLTGDPSDTARRVGQTLGFDEVYQGLSPIDKAQWIEKIQRQGDMVVFIGDGINDALALQSANVGIAVHRSASAAVHSAGIALLKDIEVALPALYHLSVRLRRIIIQNLLWAFAYNLLAIPIAMGLVPGVTITPSISALLMSLSSLTVVLNSLRLRMSS